MTTMRAIVRAQINALADDEVEVVMSTAALARDGHVLIPQGCVLDNYRANPIVLWSHDPEKPIGNSETITVAGDKISARVKFAPAGISHKADEVRGLVKAGVVRAVSVGFDPIDMEPLDPKRPLGGQRISTWELLELSFVSVPADTGALVTARAKRRDAMPEWKVGAAKGLPIEDSDDWDGAAAQASIFEFAGGDDFDPVKARKGFLVYDASAPEKRGSYKLPIAHAVDGKLQVPKGAIRAAASRLPDTDIPDAVKTDAGKVLDAYKTKAGMDEDGDRGRRAPRTRNAVRTGKLVLTRGLYQVAQLCYQFEQLGYAVDCAKLESAIEGDDSKVPAMLVGVLHDLGEALVAMTTEEVAEALAGHDVELETDGADDILVVEERARIAAAKSPAVRAFRRGLAHAKLRAGKTLSAETVRCLTEANAKDDAAIDMHRSAIRKHREAQAMRSDLMERAGAAEAEEDEDTTDIQAQDGAENDSDSGRSAEWTKRQAEIVALTAVRH